MTGTLGRIFLKPWEWFKGGGEPKQAASKSLGDFVLDVRRKMSLLLSHEGNQD